MSNLPLTPDEEADVALSLEPIRPSMIFSGCALLAMATVGGIARALLGPAVMKILLMVAVSPLLVIGYSFYRVNAVRIAEGKTSLFISRMAMLDLTTANHHHRYNQAWNVFYMIAGAGMIGAVALVDMSGR